MPVKRGFPRPAFAGIRNAAGITGWNAVGLAHGIRIVIRGADGLTKRRKMQKGDVKRMFERITVTKTFVRVFTLYLNDMRSAKIEYKRLAAIGDTPVSLENLLKAESVPQYTEEGFDENFGRNIKWQKSFRKEGPLEWFNPPLLVEDAIRVETVPEDELFGLLSWARNNGIPMLTDCAEGAENTL